MPEKATHDYVRHGTTTLFAALEVVTGRVTDDCYPRHRNDEFLRFLKLVAKTYPRVKLHVVVDNYATHKHPKVITRQAIRRGTFTSVVNLIRAIRAFIDGWNDRCLPFTWTKPADQILPHATGGKRTSITRH